MSIDCSKVPTKSIDSVVVTTRDYEPGEISTEIADAGLGFGAWDTTNNSAIEEGYLEDNRSLCFVKQADYATKYTLKLNGTSCSYTTPEATSDRARAGLATEAITSSIVSAINSKTGSHGCTATSFGSYFTVHSSNSYTIQAVDSLGGKAFFAFKHKAQNFSDLPPDAPDGFRLKILPEPDAEGEAYHVVYNKEGGVTTGTWEETVAPGLINQLDRNTMPHLLTRKQDAQYINSDNPYGIYFEFSHAPWSAREVGDYATAPFPSFTSSINSDGQLSAIRTITSMAYFKNRLVFATDENLVFSEAGNHFRFFPTTVIQPLESDAIDIAISNNKVTPIQHMIPYEKELIMFSANQQYSCSGGEIFSAETVQVVPTTGYRIDVNVAPIRVGDKIFFCSRKRNFNTIWEYVYEGDKWRAYDITKHVPNYIEGFVHRLAGNSTQDMLFVLPRLSHEDTIGFMYIYNWAEQRDERVQSAWQKWEFAAEVLDIVLEANYLRLLTRYNEGGDVEAPTYIYYYEGMNLSYDPLAEELGHPALIDRREEVTGLGIGSSDLEEWDGRIVFQFQGRAFVGFPYEQRYVFSRLSIRDSSGTPLVGGRTQARRIILNYADTSHFVVAAEVRGRSDIRSQEFNARVIGSADNIIGEIPIAVGELTFPVMGEADRLRVHISNWSPFDAVFLSAQWEAFYSYRARRL
ncbi:phage nozzle protein [Microbulbifer epialgicus]|uniref:Uncharacterized protein n=1 Tax=Microbulbifer epialgicus TaxID=393907 RepID=A0ABV4P1K5_9GAMM